MSRPDLGQEAAPIRIAEFAAFYDTYRVWGARGFSPTRRPGRQAGKQDIGVSIKIDDTTP